MEQKGGLVVEGKAELREVQRLEGHQDRVWGVAWNPTTGAGRLPPMLASCSGDRTVRIWVQEDPRNPSSWECRVRLQFSLSLSIYLSIYFDSYRVSPDAISARLEDDE